MQAIKRAAKRLPFYPELRQMWRALTDYGQLRRYITHRFWSTRRLRSLRRPLDKPAGTTNYSMHIPCCHRDTNMLLWALASWYRATSEAPQVYVHDDGSFTAGDRRLIATLLPHATVVGHKEATALAVGEWLAEFPLSRGYRSDRRAVFAVKLVDPYFVGTAPAKLIVDTDVLWLAAPSALLSRMQGYEAPVFWPARGVTPFLFRDGAWLRDDLACLNTGVVYYEKADFDLNVLEEFFARRDPSFLYQPLLDQPAYSYVLGQYRRVVTLPIHEYIIKGPARAGTVAKHYTGPRREQFWFEGVRLLLDRYRIIDGDAAAPSPGG